MLYYIKDIFYRKIIPALFRDFYDFLDKLKKFNSALIFIASIFLVFGVFAYAFNTLLTISLSKKFISASGIIFEVVGIIKFLILENVDSIINDLEENLEEDQSPPSYITREVFKHSPPLDLDLSELPDEKQYLSETIYWHHAFIYVIIGGIIQVVSVFL